MRLVFWRVNDFVVLVTFVGTLLLSGCHRFVVESIIRVQCSPEREFNWFYLC
jgi:hypothetical protein